MNIYLAGSIPKGDSETENFIDWRDHYRAVLKTVFGASCKTPIAGEVDEADRLLVVGSDCSDIQSADLVVVNAEQKLGAGTAMELVIAKYLKKPVITVLPKNTHHRRSNLVFNGALVEDWIHPFVHTFSDVVIEHIDEINQAKDVLTAPIKDITIIDQAIHYKNHNNLAKKLP